MKDGVRIFSLQNFNCFSLAVLYFEQKEEKTGEKRTWGIHPHIMYIYIHICLPIKICLYVRRFCHFFSLK